MLSMNIDVQYPHIKEWFFHLLSTYRVIFRFNWLRYVRLLFHISSNSIISKRNWYPGIIISITLFAILSIAQRFKWRYFSTKFVFMDGINSNTGTEVFSEFVIHGKWVEISEFHAVNSPTSICFVTKLKLVSG